MDIACLLKHFASLKRAYREKLVETRGLKQRRDLAVRMELLDELEAWIYAQLETKSQAEES